MFNPLVSIVIPMYNSREWIVKLLFTISEQTYKNIEIVIVNDGSSDSSELDVSHFMDTHPQLKIRIINQENKGVSNARNNGVHHSNGELIAFVDSDDIWHSTKIEDQVRKLQVESAQAVACSYVIFKDSNFEAVQIVNPDWTQRGVINWLLLRTYGGLLSSTLMLTKTAFEEVGPFDVELSLSADIEFAIRLIKIYPITLIEIPLVGYRLRENQMHHQESLLLSESKRMLKKVDLLRVPENQRIFLANLNLRLALYRLTKIDIFKAHKFFILAIKSSPKETLQTLARILLNRFKRKTNKTLENQSFLTQSSQSQSKQ